MHLKNRYPLAEISAENPFESHALLCASMRSYSPRSAGTIQSGGRCLVIGVQEIPEFIKGVTSDVDIAVTDKKSIALLLADFLNGKIQDEATTV